MKNSGKWKNESLPIIESNGELTPEHKRYRVNCSLTIRPSAEMSASELDKLVYYCQAIADSYRANREYIFPSTLTEQEKVKLSGRY